MLGRHRRLVLSGALLIALTVSNTVLAVAPEIKDGGKFFSADAIRKANKEIREIAKEYDRDLLIETVMTIPGDQAERVKALSREERARFFRNWATERAEVAIVRGVYILVCKEPAFVEIILTPQGRKAFDKESFEKLRALLLKSFHEKRYDEGLQSAVALVRERFAATNK
ncbi:MAG TPA: TPM domain-containing protein [Gemmataceae bacterium]|nr:TPM domain-containing protein [Gemmataceae bacterium]